MKHLSAPDISAASGPDLSTLGGWVPIAVGVVIALGLAFFLWRSFRADPQETDADG